MLSFFHVQRGPKELFKCPCIQYNVHKSLCSNSMYEKLIIFVTLNEFVKVINHMLRPCNTNKMQPQGL